MNMSAVGKDIFVFFDKASRVYFAGIPLDRMLFGGIAILFLLIFLFFAVWTRESKISIDSMHWSANGVSGRPDAVTRRVGKIIAHEYKSRASHKGEPFDGHVIQLQTYCYILEKVGYRVSCGLLHYEDVTFEVLWNRKARSVFEKYVSLARKTLESKSVPEKFGVWDPRCRKCQFRYICWPEANRAGRAIGGGGKQN